jgi:FkbM family methyltransferase
MISPVRFKNVYFDMFIPDIELHTDYPGANVQSYILKNNVWAIDESIIMDKILKHQKGLVIDVGANTGYFSFIGLINKCKVIAIEPNVIHTNYFNKTIEINNFPKNNIKHLEKFVSYKKEDCIFDGWSGNEHILKKDKVSLVKTISLDEICNECYFLKIDVEGAEPDVIQSAKNLIQNQKIKYIMFELTYIINNKVDDKNVNMLFLLNQYGFKLYEINNNTLIYIDNIKTKINQLSHEYFNHHKIVDPNIFNGGSNLLAIHKSAKNIFKNIKNTNNFYID